jgi:hypothetical protein
MALLNYPQPLILIHAEQEPTTAARGVPRRCAVAGYVGNSNNTNNRERLDELGRLEQLENDRLRKTREEKRIAGESRKTAD